MFKVRKDPYYTRYSANYMKNTKFPSQKIKIRVLCMFDITFNYMSVILAFQSLAFGHT